MNDERVRLFVALPLPSEVRSLLVAWRSKVVESVEGLRLIRAEDLHVTLCFLGWRVASEVEDILGACRAAVSGSGAPGSAAGSGAPGSAAPYTLRVGEALWLPPRRPRVLAVSLVDLSGMVAALQSALSDALCAGGWYKPESRPFLAHVTVARVGKGARVRADSPLSLSPASSAGFVADEVVLYRSRLSPAGARYEAVARIKLPTRG